MIHASHHVEVDQREPGLTPELQADQHVIDFTIMTLELAWSVVLSERFELDIELPVRRTVSDAAFLDEGGDEISGFTSIHHRDETIQGIGDLALSGRYRLVRPEALNGLLLDLTFGFSVPTGEIQENPFELGRKGLPHQHVFFGTGTFDPLLGVESRYGFEDFALRIDANWRGAVYENSESFQGPNTFVFRTVLESNFGAETLTYRAGVELLVEAAARWGGELAKNSGRTDLIPLIGLAWAAADDWSGFLILKKPFILDVSGGRLEMPFVVALGGAYSFEGW